MTYTEPSMTPPEPRYYTEPVEFVGEFELEIDLVGVDYRNPANAPEYYLLQVWVQGVRHINEDGLQWIAVDDCDLEGGDPECNLEEAGGFEVALRDHRSTWGARCGETVIWE